MQTDKQKYSIRDFYFWKISFCLGLGSFFIYTAMYAVQPLLPVFVQQFDVSVSQASLALSLTIIGLIVGLLVFGFLTDRWGRTIFIKISLIGSVIPFFIIPLLDSFVALILFRFIQGFALAGLPAASLAYISEEIQRRSAGVATALYISSNALGGMLGRVTTGYVTDHYSWQTAFYVLAVVGIIILAAVLLLLPPSRFFIPSEGSFRQGFEGFFFHLKNPALLVVFGLGIVLQFSFSGIWTYLSFHLQEPPFSMSIQAISNMFFAYGIGVVGAPMAGWFAGKWGLKRTRMVGIIVMTIGIFITLQPSVLAIMIGLCVTCLGFFTAHSLTAASVSEQADHHKGSASSLYLVAYYIGVALGSSALGPLWELTGWNGIVIITALVPITYFTFIRVSSTRKDRELKAS